MAEEEYILKWNDHKNNFFSLMSEDIFQQELLTDLTVCCGETLFSAHRLVLSVCSPYFRRILTSAPSNQYPIIFLKDVSAVHFESLLQFMYFGEVRIPNSELEQLIRTATSLSIKGLSAAIPVTGEVISQSRHPAEEPSYRQPESNSQCRTGPEVTPPEMRSSPTSLSTKEAHVTPLKKRRFSSDNEERASSPTDGLEASIPRRTQPFPYESQASGLHQMRGPYHAETLCSTATPTNVPVSTSSGRNHQHLVRRHVVVSTSSSEISMKEETTEDNPVSPPTQTEAVPLLITGDMQQRKALSAATSNMSITQPRVETRKTGTCYFCKKAFMKNKQLMNHVCPKKPRSGNGNSLRNPGMLSPMTSSALALIARK